MLLNVAFREVDEKTLEAVLTVTLAPEQEPYVGTVAEALEEAREVPEGKPWFRAVFDGDLAVSVQAFIYEATASDVDGDTLSYALSQGPAGASLNASTGQLVWTNPQAGIHRFSISVADGKGGTAEQVFMLTVAAPNTAPKAKDATYATGRDSSIKIDLRTLISDAENDVLTLLVSNPRNGTLSKNKDGTYTYKPNRGYTGNDSFSYTVSDGKASTTATIDVRVRQNYC